MTIFCWFDFFKKCPQIRYCFYFTWINNEPLPSFLPFDKVDSKWTSTNSDKHVQYRTNICRRQTRLLSLPLHYSLFPPLLNYYRTISLVNAFYLSNHLFMRTVFPLSAWCSCLHHFFDSWKRESKCTLSKKEQITGGDGSFVSISKLSIFSEAHLSQNDMCGLVETKQTVWE